MTPSQFQECREEMGLTRRELALLLGYDQIDPDQDYHAIKRMESGIRNISPMCSRLMVLIHRHWRATGDLPEFTE